MIIGGANKVSQSTLLKLYGAAGAKPATLSEPLDNLYLDETLVPSMAGGQNSVSPFVYANFLSSIDGRIAVEDQAAVSGMVTPAAIRSAIDWDLFCQLQASADVLVTHGGYLRSLAKGELGNVLALSTKARHQYLQQWRIDRGLKQHPQILVVSGSLQFDERLLAGLNSDVRVLTLATSSSERRNRIADHGISIDTVEKALIDDLSVDAAIGSTDVVNSLKKMNARNAYLQTGPGMLHAFAAEGLIQRLYLTLDMSLVGGGNYKSIADGALLGEYGRLQLRTLYSNTVNADQARQGNLTQQLYAAFDFCDR